MRQLIVLIFVLAWGITASIQTDRWQEEQDQRLSEDRTVLATTYRASVAMYRLATETLVTEMVQRPKVLATFAEGIHSTGTARDLARGKLYRLLSPTYAQLQERGIRQFQFHTSEGLSFLRFHAPDKYGDPLFGIRPAIRLANTEQQPVSGFELGRLVSGFRYIYPLFLDDEHLGSVETTVTFRSISSAMDEIDPGHEYALVLRKSAIDTTMFAAPRVIYVPSDVNDDFLVEDYRLQLPVSPFPPSPAVQSVNRLLQKNHDVPDNMAAAKAFSVTVKDQDTDWVISFIPVADISGENVAYVVSYGRAPFLTNLRHAYLLNLTLATLALAGLFLLSLRLLNAHTTLQQEKSHLQTVNDTIADGLYVMDREGRIVQINPAFTDILGFQADETLGRIGHDLFHVHDDGDRLPLQECPIVAATSGNRVYSGEAQFRHKNGTLLTVELACKPISSQSHITGSVTAFRDISERKAAQQRLQESDRIKSEFIATASHELRTPLAVIQGYVELLRDSDNLGPEQMQEFEAIIYEKAVALEKIIDDLLDVSHIETGRPICLELESIDIVQQLKRLADHFQKEADAHRVSANLPRSEVLLRLDRFKFNQALENLLTNAIKFSPADSEITVTGELLADRFLVTIADQGVGIAPDQLPYIFDKFFRVDTSDTAVSGFGLGLYLVKRIIEAHQGSIRVESTPGRGTSFFITLPLPAVLNDEQPLPEPTITGMGSLQPQAAPAILSSGPA